MVYILLAIEVVSIKFLQNRKFSAGKWRVTKKCFHLCEFHLNPFAVAKTHPKRAFVELSTPATSLSAWKSASSTFYPAHLGALTLRCCETHFHCQVERSYLPWWLRRSRKTSARALKMRRSAVNLIIKHLPTWEVLRVCLLILAPCLLRSLRNSFATLYFSHTY